MIQCLLHSSKLSIFIILYSVFYKHISITKKVEYCSALQDTCEHLHCIQFQNENRLI